MVVVVAVVWGGRVGCIESLREITPDMSITLLYISFLFFTLLTFFTFLKSDTVFL